MADDIVKVDDDQMSFINELLEDPNPGVDFDDPDPLPDPKTLDPVEKPVEAKIEEPLEKPAENIVEDKEEIDPQEVTIAALREQLLALTDALQSDPLKQTVKEDIKGTESREKMVDSQDQSQQKTDILQQFLTEEELDRLIDEPALINLAFSRSQQAMMGSIGQLVQIEVNKQILVNKAITDFYTANSDLLPYAKFVQYTMQEVETKNRDKTYAEIFQMTAEESRKRLGLSTTTAQTRETNKGTQRPAFAGSKKGNARPAGATSIFDENARDML
jgi:hypothetical protein